MDLLLPPQGLGKPEDKLKKETLSLTVRKDLNSHQIFLLNLSERVSIWIIF